MKKLQQYKHYHVEVLENSQSGERAYELVEVRILKTTGAKLRRKIINQILDEREAIGAIECWGRGGIVRKPMFNFCLLLISEKS